MKQETLYVCKAPLKGKEEACSTPHFSKAAVLRHMGREHSELSLQEKLGLFKKIERD